MGNFKPKSGICFSIHQEVASDSFCFLINSSWLLVFVLFFFQLMIRFIVLSSFFLTGLHFFHLVVGLLLLCLFFWGCSFPFKIYKFINLRVSEVHLFYNLQLFYW